ncbi:MAG: histidinol phosphate phosphatase domain-containing protein [Chloroflexi bacterium]|nr:histidinol phosphate phosphatase domain-containing protein [Chloroflexota bacterium]MCL5107751.1 histidinol phosphate phosphatase domain-containing protein [Chloroflexota bacterium]
MLYDFHTHTFLSDGVLSPVELVRRALVRGYSVIAIADHVGLGTCEATLKQVVADCELVNRYWPILALPAVELTHVPVGAVAEVARRAKGWGAALVVAHGESIVEPVEPGTNLAALRSPDVDVLAHPGLLTLEEAELAAANGIFLELSARKGHSLTNGHVWQVGNQAGALFLLNSDAHEPDDLLTEQFAQQVVLGAGLPAAEAAAVLSDNPPLLLQRLGLKLPKGR